MDIDKACRQLQALAQKTRLKLFRTLVVAGPQGVNAGDLCKSLSVSCSALSFHLSQLTESNLIQSRREGRFIIYSVNDQAADCLISYLRENCCHKEVRREG